MCSARYTRRYGLLGAVVVFGILCRSFGQSCCGGGGGLLKGLGLRVKLCGFWRIGEMVTGSWGGKGGLNVYVERGWRLYAEVARGVSSCCSCGFEWIAVYLAVFQA